MTDLKPAKSIMDNITYGLFQQEVLLRICQEAAAVGKVTQEDVPYILSTMEMLRSKQAQLADKLSTELWRLESAGR